MRIPISLALAIVVSGMPLTGTYAQTRRPTAQEVAAIRNCATQYQDDVDEGERQCLFNLVATPCTKTREGSSNLGTADCYRVEWVIWDNLLNENFKNLMGALDNQRIAKLRAMQAGLDHLPRHHLQFLHGKDSRLDGHSDGGGLRGARNRSAGAAASVFRSDLGRILHKTGLFNPAAGHIPEPH
jgi:hypothetical protein